MFGELIVPRDPPKPERTRLLAAAQYFRERGILCYTAPRNVEHIPLAELQATPTTSGVYRALEVALWETGTRVNSNVGAIMAAFDMSQKELHDVLCYCHNGESVMAAHLATSLTNLANTK
jgi:hypothetical protein